VNDEFELTETLTIKHGKFPATMDSPEGAIVMIQKRHGGQITMSKTDWIALVEFCQGYE
jgi:hypothetical protein